MPVERAAISSEAALCRSFSISCLAILIEPVALTKSPIEQPGAAPRDGIAEAAAQPHAS